MHNKGILNKIDNLLKRLFPIYRSLTGEGNRETLKILQEIIPLEIKEFNSGDKVFDWVIPDEYEIKSAWIKNEKGNRIIDFNNSNLHVVSYSTPVNKKMTFNELSKNLYYLDDIPDAIPYRTTYYSKDWGFCVNKKQFEILSEQKGKLHVFIDSEFNPKGNMTYGEFLIPGKSEKEILLSTYICHPSMANDNLSGFILTTLLADRLLENQSLRYSYRIIFVPETIGAIAYCAKNEKIMKNIDIGFILSTVGGPGKFGYKESWDANHRINKIINKVFIENNIDFVKYLFDPNGSDERQYSSPYFRINTPVISKDKFYEYKYYHTSLDNLDFVKPQFIIQSLELYSKVIDELEKEIIYKNIKNRCEVMLGRRNLYPSTGGSFLPDAENEINKLDIILWILNHCDGKSTLNDLEKKSNIKLEKLVEVSEELVENNLLERIIS